MTHGGGWLLGQTGEVFSPERMSDDHRMIAQTVQEFMTNEVVPALDALEQKDWSVARALIVKAGELGLLGTDIPEELGGVALDKAATLIIGDAVGRVASFSTTFGAQTGLSAIPLLCAGTDAQQRAYLPRLASGEMLGAYALSESGSGSDALAARARAVRQPDGSFVLNGEKMWITCGGFADLFIVFAQVTNSDDAASGSASPAFSAFIVERAFAGVSNGKEEHKMGLHGSSTTPLILQDVRVPAENLLGEVGRGHKVALNTLNYGRFKLAAMCSGGAKAALAQAATYAAGRKQFNQPIAAFGAIQHKLGEMTARTYAVESMLYRFCGEMDGAVNRQPSTVNLAAVLEDFAIEAAILKVAGSDMIDFVVDETVQIHGGNGFVTDYPAERFYRDARVNRIFEGTNEINRMIVPGMLARRAAKGAPPLIDAAKALAAEVAAASSSSGDATTASPATSAPNSDDLFAAEAAVIEGLRKAALFVLGTAMQTYGAKMADEQEAVSFTADVIIAAYAAESALLRARQAQKDDAPRAALHAAAARITAHTAAARAAAAAREALAAMTTGQALDAALAAIARWLAPTPPNLVTDRRALAAEAVRLKRYIFDTW